MVSNKTNSNIVVIKMPHHPSQMEMLNVSNHFKSNVVNHSRNVQPTQHVHIPAIYWKRNHKTDEELEEILKESHGSKIQGNREKKQDMVKFFAAMKDPTGNPQQEQRMREVLYGGKGDKKRHYAVDDSLYGTDEGVEKRMEAEATLKRKKKKRKKKKKKAVDDELDTDVSKGPPTDNKNIMFEGKSVAVAGTMGVGILALVALSISGKRS